ncbi:MAG: Na/Pi cotransporter family protein [Deltaproteobacteria bacterium]|nr:Na/Pi cotransporter family protein [Deltaproteobacteria bacterium]
MNLHWITIVGGICLLMYGLNLTRDSLQKIAGDRLEQFLKKLTEKKLIAFFTGFLMTLILQSSSASIAMAVGFTSQALLTLTQSMAIILGADVATTLTVQIIAFKIANYSLLLVIFGFFITTLFGEDQIDIGHFFMGLGFIFLGMWFMSKGSEPFQSSAHLTFFLSMLKEHTIISLLLAMTLTALFQSSAAFLGILISLAHSNILSLPQALPLILGANIGGCALPLLVSLRTNDRGQQVAIAHIVLKTGGVLLILPFLSHIESWVSWSTLDVSRQIANAHVLFNVSLALLFLPVIRLGNYAIQKIYPLHPEPEKFSPKYLDLQVLGTPSFALGQAQREALRMAGLVQEMLEKIIIALKKTDHRLIQEIEELEDRSDLLYREIKRFLIRISQKSISVEQAQAQLDLVMLVSDLENIGDTIEKSLLPLIKIKKSRHLLFSKEGLHEMEDYHRQIVEGFQLALSAFTTKDVDLCHKLIRQKQTLLELELELREKHLERLRKGVQESLDTSAMHLEILSYLRRIHSFISNLAYPILQRKNGK